ANIDFPGNNGAAAVTISSNDPNVRVFADYTLDWTVNSVTLPEVKSRLVMAVPDANPGNNMNFSPGAPALSSDNNTFYGFSGVLSQSGIGTVGTGVLAVNEQQNGRTAVRWAYLF